MKRKREGFHTSTLSTKYENSCVSKALAPKRPAVGGVHNYRHICIPKYPGRTVEQSSPFSKIRGPPHWKWGSWSGCLAKI